jgi:hypothetical protein
MKSVAPIKPENGLQQSGTFCRKRNTKAPNQGRKGTEKSKLLRKNTVMTADTRLVIDVMRALAAPTVGARRFKVFLLTKSSKDLWWVGPLLEDPEIPLDIRQALRVIQALKMMC